LVRSAMAPDTIVAAVAANIVWNIIKAMRGIDNPKCSALPCAAKRFIPKRPYLLTPNIIPKPTSQNTIVPTAKSIRFFIMIFAALFARVKPLSAIAKPACIINTRKPAIRVHIVSIATALDSAVGPSAAQTNPVVNSNINAVNDSIRSNLLIIVISSLLSNFFHIW